MVLVKLNNIFVELMTLEQLLKDMRGNRWLDNWWFAGYLAVLSWPGNYPSIGIGKGHWNN